jgi:hypothetical protein
MKKVIQRNQQNPARLEIELAAVRSLGKSLASRLAEIELLPAMPLRQAFSTPNK